MRDHTNSREERELERLQQMLDMEDEEQTYRQEVLLTYEW